MRREEENKKRKNKGFTLVELIIVIAILAVIAAVAAPNLIGNIKKARVTADISNAKVIADTALVLIAQNESYESITLTNQTVIKSEGATLTSEQSFVNEILSNLQKAPVPSAGSYDKYLISVDDGAVKVYAAIGSATTGIELYPNALSTYAD
jgi:type IV pilus assembly protein PilA